MRRVSPLLILAAIFGGAISFIWAVMQSSPYIMLVTIAFFIIATLVYSGMHIEARFGHFILIGTIFIFLLSRTYYRALSGLKLEPYFSDDEVYRSLLYICISIITIFFFEMIFASSRRIHKNKRRLALQREQGLEINTSFLSICKVCFWVSAACKVIVLVLKIVLVQSVGYSESYLELTDTISGIPSIITKLSDFYLVTFAIITASFKDFKTIKVYVYAFIVIAAMGLFTGARNNFFVPIVFLIWLIAYYNYMNSDELGIPKIGHLFRLKYLLLIYAGIVLIGITGQVRVGMPVDASVFNPFKMISDNLGGSNLVILRTFAIADGITEAESQQFIFGPFLNFFNNNAITKLFFATETPAYGTVEYAMNGRNFGSYLTYKSDLAFYSVGGGFGSSYIAEAYIHSGIVGIIAISALYSWFLSIPYKIKPTSWIKKALYFLMVYWVFYTPRDAALYFLTAGLNITNLIFIILIAACSNLAGKYSSGFGGSANESIGGINSSTK